MVDSDGKEMTDKDFQDLYGLRWWLVYQLTKPWEWNLQERNGLKIVGHANVPGRVANNASSLYSKNMFNFVENLLDKENKKININLEDEIIEKTLIK